VAGALLALVALLAYASTPFNFWVGDDYNYLVPKDIGRVISFFDPTVPTRAFYRPINWTTWAIDYALWGPVPFGWHITSMVFHVVTTLVVALLAWRLLLRLPRSQAEPAQALPIHFAHPSPEASVAERPLWSPGYREVSSAAVLAGALFAVHPSHPEAVTFIGGRADLVCGLFYFPAVLLFVVYLQRRMEGKPAGLFYVLAFLMAVGALLSKEAGVTLPLALLITDLCFFPSPRHESLTGRWWLRLRPHLPFLMLIAGYGFMRYYLVAAGVVTNTYAGPSMLTPQQLLDATTSNILLFVGVWGAPFMVPGLPTGVKLMVIAGAVAASVLAVKWIGRPATYCLLWMALTLMPTANLSALRWLYIPSWGVCLLAALVAVRLMAVSYEWRSTALTRLGHAFAIAVLALWGLGVVYQNVLWYRAGEEARSILTQIRNLLPDTDGPVNIYFAGAPSNYDTVLLFNTGLPAAMSFVSESGNVKLHELDQPLPDPVVGDALSNPPRLRPNAVFMGYREGRVYRYSSLEQLLQAGIGKH
jgi:hypothetical protein